MPSAQCESASPLRILAECVQEASPGRTNRRWKSDARHSIVVPANAGTHTLSPSALALERTHSATINVDGWVPAFAGTTRKGGWHGTRPIFPARELYQSHQRFLNANW